jgi:hypothetical protein
MAMSKHELWQKAGRFITGVAVLCFFLPFFGVSCAGVDLVSIKGTDMVGGCQPSSEPMGDGDSDLKIDKVDVEPLAIIALVLVVGAAGFAWVRSRKAVIASMVLSIAAIGALAGLYVKVSGELNDAVEEEVKRKESAKRDPDSPSSDLNRDIERMISQIDAGGRMGLWAALVFLLGSATLAGMALREKTPVATAPPPGAAPPGYPPAGPPPA